MRQELGTVNGLTITFIGDLKYGRTVHSLCELLKHYHVKVQLVCPSELSLPAKVRKGLEKRGQLVGESETLTNAIVSKSDVLYVTRVQKERFADLDLYERVKNELVVSAATLQAAKESMIVMHPLPRNEELTKEVDNDPRAAYFSQVSHSVSFAQHFTDSLTDEVRHVRPHGAAGVGHGQLSRRGT